MLRWTTSWFGKMCLWYLQIFYFLIHQRYDISWFYSWFHHISPFFQFVVQLTKISHSSMKKYVLSISPPNNACTNSGMIRAVNHSSKTTLTSWESFSVVPLSGRNWVHSEASKKKDSSGANAQRESFSSAQQSCVLVLSLPLELLSVLTSFASCEH